MKHQDEKALAVMVALEGVSLTSESSTAKRDLEEIQSSIAFEQSPMKKRETMPRFRLVLGVAVQAMQQLTGINVVCYYLPYLLVQSVDVKGPMARFLAAINAMTYLGATFFGLNFVERWGRRRLMIYGAIGQCCSWLAITVLLDSADKAVPGSTRQHQFGSGAVLFFFIFNIFFGASWQGVSWLYPTEINSTQNRISGMSYGVATNWLINFGVVFGTPMGIASLKSKFYLIWTVFNGCMVPILYLFFPETAGRSLEDIDGMFEAYPTIWVYTNRNMTERKPKNSKDSQDGGDEGTVAQRGRALNASSKTSSAIELAPPANLHQRHRQLGGGATPLGSMTSAEHGIPLVEDGTVAGNTAGAAGVEIAADAVEEYEDAHVSSLQMAPINTVLSGSAALEPQSPKAML